MIASNIENHNKEGHKMQKFHMYIIDSRTQNKYHVCGVDTQAGWQLADKISAARCQDLEPMEMTVRQIHLATKQLKDCIGDNLRTIEVVPA